MSVEELIVELQKLPQHYTVEAFASDGDAEVLEKITGVKIFSERKIVLIEHSYPDQFIQEDES